MLRSVGAGERATAPGHPVVPGNWYPYRDLIELFISSCLDCTNEVAPGSDVTDNPQIYRTWLFRRSG